MAGIHITDIESAINWWRQQQAHNADKLDSEGLDLSPPLQALAQVYALMVYYRESECDEQTMPEQAKQAWLQWYATTPDTPCIAICSTSQGDAVCKGCGRRFDEVQRWPAMTPGERRASWRRITLENPAWRFNRYAERAAGAAGGGEPAPATPEASTPTLTQRRQQSAG